VAQRHIEIRKALASYGIALRSWQEALEAYLKDLGMKGKLP